MLMATLLVIVFVVEAETPVETRAFPVNAGIVIVLVPATAGTVTVTVPLVSPEIITLDIFILFWRIRHESVVQLIFLLF